MVGGGKDGRGGKGGRGGEEVETKREQQHCLSLLPLFVCLSFSALFCVFFFTSDLPFSAHTTLCCAGDRDVMAGNVTSSGLCDCEGNFKAFAL